MIFIFFELVDFVGLCGLELEECNKCINLLYLFRNVKLMVLFWSGWFGSCVLLIELKIDCVLLCIGWVEDFVGDLVKIKKKRRINMFWIMLLFCLMVVIFCLICM